MKYQMKYFSIILMLSASLFSPVTNAGFLDSLGNLFDISKVRLQEYSKVIDKALVDQFYSISDDGKTIGVSKLIADNSKPNQFRVKKLTTSSLTMEQTYYRVGSSYELNNLMSRYSHDPLSDAIGQTYASFAASRGGIVKMYRPGVTRIIGTIFDQSFMLDHAQNTMEWVDKDPTLIEYDQSGAIVSFMIRSHQVFVGIGAEDTQYINLYFGKGNTQLLENSIGNDALQNNFVRVVTASASGQGATQAVAQPTGGVVAPAANSDIPPVPPPAKVDPVPDPASMTSVQRIKLLKDLVELKRAGALSDTEFEAEKAKILK